MPKNVDLKVPYAQKDAAKALGAWWSSDRKCWFVPAGVLLAPFAEWLPAGDWLAQNDQPKAKRAPKTPRKLSMTNSAIRTREKKAAARAAKSPGRAAGRPDDASGKITIGVNYRPQEGAIGLPWAT